MRAFRRHRNQNTPDGTALGILPRNPAQGRIRIHGQPVRGIGQNENSHEKIIMLVNRASLFSTIATPGRALLGPAV
jgi:hypothetical protein